MTPVGALKREARALLRPNLSELGPVKAVAWRCNLPGNVRATASLDQPCARRLSGMAGRDKGKAASRTGENRLTKNTTLTATTTR